MGGRGALKDRDVRRHQQRLRAMAETLYPQIEGAAWRHAWGGNVAMTPSHEPGLHRIAPNVTAGIGFNGRGVAMATVMGTILADWAQGVPDADLDFPVSDPRPIPFHRFRNIGVGATVAWFRTLDRLGL
jgi:Glycine/D-amino acid oxidases (deaminating)